MYLSMFKRLKKKRDREVITKGKNPSTPSLLFLCPVWRGALHKQVNDLLAVFPVCQYTNCHCPFMMDFKIIKVNDLDRLSGLPIQITYGQRPQYY